jgi:hypothetical protein
MAKRSEPLSEILRGIFADERPTIEAVLVTLEDRGFGALLVLLALPAALPLPAVGYAIPFGLGILCLGMEILGGRRKPWLPQRVLALRLPRARPEFWAFRFLAQLERLVGEHCPRPTGAIRLLIGLVLGLMGLLMMIPVPGTNTLPGACVFIIGLGLLYLDGRLVISGVALGFTLLGLYVATAFGIFKLLLLI